MKENQLGVNQAVQNRLVLFVEPAFLHGESCPHHGSGGGCVGEGYIFSQFHLQIVLLCLHVLGVDLVFQALHGEFVFVVFVLLERFDGLLLALDSLFLGFDFNLLRVRLFERVLSRFFEFFGGGTLLSLVEFGI